MVPQVRRQNYLNEITSAVGSAFLGLTIGCARCHDHKYDPIPTKEFYQLQAFFAPLQHAEREANYLEVEKLGSYERTKKLVDAELAKRQGAFDAFHLELREKLAEARHEALAKVTDALIAEVLENKDGKNLFDEKERKRHETLKKAVADYKEPKAYAAVAWTVSYPKPEGEPVKTHVLIGGDVARPGEQVHPGFLSAAAFSKCQDSSWPPSRIAVADWLLDRRHPLTARVLANRLWQYHFGTGIVATPNDFGKNGAKPTHPKLLDYLAAELMDKDWHWKPLHRLMLLSRTYAMASTHPSMEHMVTRDPDNRLLWHAPLRRLEAEVIRDQILAVSGRLSLESGGPGFFEAVPKEMKTKTSFFSWDASPEVSRVRRSLYIYQRRNMVMPMMEDGGLRWCRC